MLTKSIKALALYFIWPIIGLVSFFSLAAAEDVRFEEVFDTGAYNMGVFQDRLGFLWLTTSNGLIRYDGYDQEVFKEGPDGLTSNLVPCVYEDSEGLMWIVTLSGLDLYDREKGTFSHFRHDPANPAGIGSSSFNWAPRLVAEDQNGLIWIGTRAGLYSYNKKTAEFNGYKQLPGGDPHGLSADDVWTVVADREGYIWVGTAAGLDRYDPARNTFTHFIHEGGDENALHSPGKGIVYAITEDRHGDIWVGTSEGGLSIFSKKENTFRHYRHDPADPASLACDEVFSITEDSDGNLWLGRSFSKAVGLERFNRSTGTFTLFTSDQADSGSLCGNIVLSCFADRSGILWVPENTGKVQKVDPYSHRFELYAVDSNNPATKGLHGLTSVYEDSRGDIWTGGQQGLSRYHPGTGTWTYFPADPGDEQALWNQYAFSVFEDSDGNFWVSTDDGYLNLFDRDRGIVLRRYRNPLVAKTARMIIEDRTNPDIFWFGIENYGLFKFNRKSGRFTGYESRPDAQEGLLEGFVVSLLQDENGWLWIQSHGGLYHFDPRTEKFIRFIHDADDPNSIASNVVNDLHIDAQGGFWVSTDRGLHRFDPHSGRFRRYGKAHGFPTMSIRTILEGIDGSLWLGSDAGLIVFDPELDKVTRVYTREDGLQDDSFSLYGTSAARCRDGRMWFVGLNGANSFYPGKIISNPFNPPVYLTSLTQGGEAIVANPAVSGEKEVSLDWRHNFFEFTYSALNFSQPGHNQYKYLLEGWDKDWFYAGRRRFGRYSGLSGGDYTLKIVAANNDGIWSDAPFTIRIHVADAFWSTWWFYSLVTTAAFILFYLFYFIRTSGLKRFNRELETAYARVQQAEEKYRTIFENATEGIFQSNGEGKLLAANAEMARIMGYDSSEQMLAEIDSIPSQVYVDPEDRIKLIRRLREKGRVASFETRFRKKDNSIIWVSISVRTNTEEHAEHPIYDGIVKDITRRRQVEQELDAHRRNLEQLVEERTKKIHEANLQLRKEIEERRRIEEELLKSRKLESIGVLAGGIAHDFNNLLSVVVGRLDLAKLRLPPGSKSSEDIDAAMTATQRATELTSKFITFASGGKPVKKLTDVKEVARNAVDLALSGSGVKPFYSMEPDLWPVTVDRNQVSQAFFNIIENARDAMEDSGTLRIRGKNLVVGKKGGDSGLPLPPGNYIMICFQDEGRGIPDMYLSRIFDPYFTMNAKDGARGKGLGLSITYSIIRNHNGYIFVDSREGEGASVYVYLPALPGQNLPEKPGGPEAASRGGRILVMDDEAMLRELARSILEILGHEVALSEEGESAFALYEKARTEGRPFDLLILDLTIPGGQGGQDLMKRLMQSYPDVRAVVSSGYANDPVMSNYREYGFVQALPKPYSLDRMKAVVNEILL